MTVELRVSSVYTPDGHPAPVGARCRAFRTDRLYRPGDLKTSARAEVGPGRDEDCAQARNPSIRHAQPCESADVGGVGGHPFRRGGQIAAGTFPRGWEINPLGPYPLYRPQVGISGIATGDHRFRPLTCLGCSPLSL
jgi:hypothetical protein